MDLVMDRQQFCRERDGWKSRHDSIFLLALALTVTVLSVQKKIWVIDSNILLQLSFGFVFSVMTIWGRRTAFYKQGHFGGWGTHFRLLLCAAVSGYSLWFWIDGVVDPTPNCFLRESRDGLRWFMFANVKMSDSWVRTIAIVVSALASVYFGTMLLVAMVTFARSIVLRERWNTDELEMRQALRSWTLFQVALAVVNLLFVLYTMLSVEFTLNFNNVAGVLANAGIANSSQLTPLLIGTLTFVRLLYTLYKERWAHQPDHQAETQSPIKGADLERPSRLLPRLL
ncbi:hypothetical protein LTR78_003858 [Recurvomyces mirabilis]|uniref:Uncharacterized protein n=1 Tax=Recurvomyces mirabilis TaxID=574656 RepID=A0AAE1C2X3_9PEZI|nr:hypothetical protein LTR78_003858 [Recurvomyces mirabilis]KAK5154003.1 hypothetical protein LTS14_007223 [Recurvomyces mirabilis]